MKITNLKPMLLYKTLLFITIHILFFSCSHISYNEESYKKWDEYLGDKGRSHYSSLSEINLKNVNSLKVAWTYNSGDADIDNKSQIQCSPIVIDSILYGTNPKIKLFALNAGTGEEIWQFDPDDKVAPGWGVNLSLIHISEPTRPY